MHFGKCAKCNHSGYLWQCDRCRQQYCVECRMPCNHDCPGKRKRGAGRRRRGGK